MGALAWSGRAWPTCLRGWRCTCGATCETRARRCGGAAAAVVVEVWGQLLSAVRQAIARTPDGDSIPDNCGRALMLLLYRQVPRCVFVWGEWDISAVRVPQPAQFVDVTSALGAELAVYDSAPPGWDAHDPEMDGTRAPAPLTGPAAVVVHLASMWACMPGAVLCTDDAHLGAPLSGACAGSSRHWGRSGGHGARRRGLFR